MKKLLIALLVVALVASTDGIYACDSYMFSSNSKNLDMHRILYSYVTNSDGAYKGSKEQDLIELSPGQSFPGNGVPTDITVKVIANGDINNTRSCNISISALGDVYVSPISKNAGANVTAQCPDVTFNSKTCELKLTDVQ